MLASIQPRALVHHATGAATSRAKSRVSTTTTRSLSHRQRRNVGRRHNDNAVSLVVSRAISQPSPTSATDKSTPSLHDYDGDQYEETIHDQGFVPRLERAINHAVVESSVLIIDKLFEGRDYPRFYALETVARVPYFSFLSVLHLYETLGFWRRADYLKVHFAQTMNEFHHLLIMESLGGDRKFIDRFFAQHLALGYYGIACLMYMVSPRMAYNLSEQVEEHAYHTYDGFLTEQEATLKACPPPPIAVHYYTEGDLFLFDEFQTGSVGGVAPRRPKIENLYDVFVNVRNDEVGPPSSPFVHVCQASTYSLILNT